MLSAPKPLISNASECEVTEQDLTQLPKTRKEAKSLGIKYYFTGIECPQGHISKRLTSDYGCNECKKEDVRKWVKENPERAALKAKESRQRHHGAYIKRHKEWRSKNREKVRSQTKKYYQNNKEKCSEMIKNWRISNPEASRAITHRYISRKKGAEGRFSKKDVGLMLIKQNNLCLSCSADLTKGFHVDHIMPLALGGTNWPDNIQILCPKCNCTKSDKHPDEWKEYLRKQAIGGTALSDKTQNAN